MLNKEMKVRAIHNHGVMRDYTVGKVYHVHTFTPAGFADPDGAEALYDSYTFRDDVGENVTVWLDGSYVEVVE